MSEPTEPVAAQHVAANLADVRARIAAAGGDPDRITVVAVTKGFGVDAWAAALEAGLTEIGESYAQELVDKHAEAEQLGLSPRRVHFIGRLQSNKVRAVAGSVGLWQSVDRSKLVRELGERAPGASILIQVDISHEETKGGCPSDAAPGLVEQARGAGLHVEGLMGMAAPGEAARAEEQFVRLVDLADRLDLPVRSMGMTGDLEAAVKAGSTMVRVGSALFGPRPDRR